MGEYYICIQLNIKRVLRYYKYLLCTYNIRFTIKYSSNLIIFRINSKIKFNSNVIRHIIYKYHYYNNVRTITLSTNTHIIYCFTLK